jgi:hypothetical protein
MFLQNGGAAYPLTITDVYNPVTHLGGTEMTLTSEPILWSIPNTLGTGLRAGLITLDAYTTGYVSGDVATNMLTETGFSGTGSIFDVVTNTVWLRWTFGPTGTLTVANGGHSGTFADSNKLTTEVTYASPYVTLADLANDTFHFTMLDSTSPWQSNGYPILPPGNILCTNCRLAPNTASIWSDDGAPEPATMVLLGSALLGLGFLGRKRFVR